MNVTCGSAIIDTDENHEIHKKSVQKISGSMLCDRSEPKQFFTQLINGYTRFYELYYDKSGETLKKIEYWDRKKDSERKKKWVKVPKYGDDDCYFSKNKKGGEYKLKEELDFWDIAHPHVTVWKRHWWN